MRNVLRAGYTKRFHSYSLFLFPPRFCGRLTYSRHGTWYITPFSTSLLWQKNPTRGDILHFWILFCSVGFNPRYSFHSRWIFDITDHFF